MNTIRSLAALAALLLAGCASNDTATVVQSDQARRTYSQERIRSTGENTVGEGLAKTDASVRVSGR